jgi:hypothetical protein
MWGKFGIPGSWRKVDKASLTNYVLSGFSIEVAIDAMATTA